MTRQERPKYWPPRWPDVLDPVVLDAIASVPRHLFVPPEYEGQAYRDVALPIAHGQTISQPYIVALMTQALRLTPASRVLEVGTGSGYQAAVLATITPRVWSIETHQELAEAAQARLAALGLAVEVKVGDGSLGWPEHAPYDAIVVTAAGPEVPPALVDQLAADGRLVIPLGRYEDSQELWAIERTGDGLRRRWLADVRFVPLVSERSGSAPEDDALVELRGKLRDLFSDRRY